MSRTSSCIMMLELLNTGRVYKIKELAELLETNERNILEYKKELEKAGYDILSIAGRYGGYKLANECLFPSLKLIPEEKKALAESYEYLLSKKDFMNKDNYQKGMSKVLSSLNHKEELSEDSLIVLDKYQLVMDDKSILERYQFVNEAIKNKEVIEITYNSIKNGLIKHVLHPYKLFIYNNSWFFLAWNPKASDVWYFKVSRIQDYKGLKEHFEVWKYFNERKYFNEFGLANNGLYYECKFIASKERANLMKERLYGRNQVVKDLEDGKVLVSLEMQNKNSIINYCLSCGEDLFILEPLWLKEAVLEKVEKILNLYK